MNKIKQNNFLFLVLQNYLYKDIQKVQNLFSELLLLKDKKVSRIKGNIQCN